MILESSHTILWLVLHTLAEHVCKTSKNMRGKIPKSLPQTIVGVNNFVWKPGISTIVLVPLIGMTVAICHKNICVLLANDVMLTSIYKVSSVQQITLMKTAGLECRNVGSWVQSCLAIAFINQCNWTSVAVKYIELMTTITCKGSFPLIARINSQARCHYFHPITMPEILF